jgi:hypothetical protein
MTSALFLTWQDPDTRSWYPVGRLTREYGEYIFVYTKGALESPRFIPFGSMNQVGVKYVSPILFPLFSNRLLGKSRPEYTDYLCWLGLQQHSAHPLELLARTGGERATDSLQIYPCPEPTVDGRYQTYFFCHGIRHLRSFVSSEVEVLEAGQQLLPMFDILNSVDQQAVAIRTTDPAMMIGYSPRYLARDIRELATLSRETFDLRVERVNRDAPIRFRLLCRLAAAWPDGFEPCSEPTFQPIDMGTGGQKERIFTGG